MVRAALVAFAAAVFLCGKFAMATCGPADPTGYFEGTAQSKEAGALHVTLNLRCDAGRYDGNLVTPVGTFDIRGGSYTNGHLTLQFGGGAIGDQGTIDLQLNGDKAAGSFRLAADSGPFSLTRLGPARVAASTQTVLGIPKQQWRDDLHFVVNELTTKHVDPYRFTSQQTLQANAESLDSRLDALNPDQIYMGMDHIANLIGDGHTYVEFPPDLALFPLVVQRFGQEYRVVEATGDGRPALGMRVMRINGIPVQQVHDQLLAAITPIGETDVLRDARAQNFLNIGMALHGLGIIPDRNQATFTLETDSGTAADMTFHALSPQQADEAQRPQDDFWYTYLADAKTVYCSFRAYENLSTLAPGLIEFVKAKQPEKLVIDLRLNSGGDYKEGLKYLIDPIASLASINRKGHLFVLIGANTFSAAMSNAAQFRTKTSALLVGQTIGERPNSSQEANEVRLPNSHLLLRYSTQYYEFLPGNTNMIVPDKVIVPTWQDFKQGRDPPLDWVLTQNADPPAQGRSPAASSAITVPPSQIDKAVASLDGIATTLLKRTGVPGMAIAVVHDDKVVYIKGFGVRKAGTQQKVDVNTVFELASVSKPLGAAVIAGAVGRGIVKWSDPVAKYVPGFTLSDPYVGRTVTIADMYAHRSGLPDHAGDLLEDLGYDRSTVLRRLALEPLDPFRITYHYTNFGLTAAAQAVANAAKTSWEDLSRDVLYTPLGMTSTSSLFADYANATDKAVLHVRIGNKWVAKFTRDADAQSPAGGASSSVRDMAQWLRFELGYGMYNGKQIVDRDALLETWKPNLVSNPIDSPISRASFYGLGTGVSYDPAGRLRLSHSGGFASGGATTILMLPSEKLGIVVLTNGMPIGLPESVANEFMDVAEFGKVERDWYAGYSPIFARMYHNPSKLAGKSPPASAAPAKPNATYTGTYANAYYGPATVEARTDGLALLLGPHRKAFKLTHWDGNTFSYEPAGENAVGISAVSFVTEPGAMRAGKVVIENLDENKLGTFVRR